jgi:beta-lactamase class D
MTRILLIIFIFFFNAFASSQSLDEAIRAAISKQNGVCVFVNGKTGEIVTSDSIMANTRFTPCSTFKIWNTLIGIECQVIQSADELFYKWDNISRFLPAWNKDQTLKEAFHVSCVPAYQNLARKIGIENMEKWIAILNYGDKDISSGVDDFWLPRKGKKSITISPIEQAQLIRKLINGDLPFSKQSRKILEGIMLNGKIANGTYYGKTGSGSFLNTHNEEKFGWYVGYVNSKDKTYSFACIIKGKNVSGKDAKQIIESILKQSELI